MASFTCEARDARGGLVQRTLDAASEGEAVQMLERAGLFPLEIAEVTGRAAQAAAPRKAAPPAAARAGGASEGRVDKRFRGKALMNFTIQLGTSLGAGVPILAALAAIARQTPDPQIQAVLGQMIVDVEGGLSLSAAMRNHPKAFPHVFASTVAAGEQSGSLDEVLANLAEYLETDLEVRSDVRSALLYPSIVIGTLILAIGVLILFVVPRFAGFYSGFQQELPLPTRLLMGGSRLLTEYFVPAVMVLLALGWGFAQVLQTHSGRRAFDGALMRIPVISRLVEVVNTLHVTQMLGLFTRAGVPIVQGLEIIARTVSSSHVRERLQAVAGHVSAGLGLAASMEEADCLPPTARQMLASGEASGTLEVSCAAVSNQHKKELRYITRNLATLIEPLLTLVLAVIVLFVALAVFLPMWDMVKVVRN